MKCFFGKHRPAASPFFTQPLTSAAGIKAAGFCVCTFFTQSHETEVVRPRAGGLKKGAEDTRASVWSKFNRDFIHTSSPLNAHDDAHTVKRRGNLPHGVRKKNMSVREECAENPSV